LEKINSSFEHSAYSHIYRYTIDSSTSALVLFTLLAKRLDKGLRGRQKRRRDDVTSRRKCEKYKYIQEIESKTE
jgi:hypothetical protein